MTSLAMKPNEHLDLANAYVKQSVGIKNMTHSLRMKCLTSLTICQLEPQDFAHSIQFHTSTMLRGRVTFLHCSMPHS